jgi:uncharacterized membrane protein YkvA (DUF1232 family)
VRERKRKSGKRGRKTASALLPVLPHLLRLLGGLLRDRRVSWLHKGLLAGVLVYVVSPLDLIPDVFGVLGWTDDLFLIGLAVRQLVLGAGEEVVESHWTGSRGTLRSLQEGLGDLGGLLPGPVRGLLESYARRW